MTALHLDVMKAIGASDNWYEELMEQLDMIRGGPKWPAIYVLFGAERAA